MTIEHTKSVFLTTKKKKKPKSIVRLVHRSGQVYFGPSSGPTCWRRVEGLERLKLTANVY